MNTATSNRIALTTLAAVALAACDPVGLVPCVGLGAEGDACRAGRSDCQEGLFCQDLNDVGPAGRCTGVCIAPAPCDVDDDCSSGQCDDGACAPAGDPF